jgi:hypothetical protein
MYLLTIVMLDSLGHAARVSNNSQRVTINCAMFGRRPYQLVLPCLVKVPGRGRSAVCISPFPGEAYSHCLVRTNVWT